MHVLNWVENLKGDILFEWKEIADNLRSGICCGAAWFGFCWFIYVLQRLKIIIRPGRAWRSEDSSATWLRHNFVGLLHFSKALIVTCVFKKAIEKMRSCYYLFVSDKNKGLTIVFAKLKFIPPCCRHEKKITSAVRNIHSYF